MIGPNGKTIYQNSPDKTTVFTSGEAYAGTQTLETVLQYGTGTGASYGCPAAGKTGTTSNYTDAWFVGYTPRLSTAVWVGYPNADVYMNDVNGLGPGYGGTLAAPIWRDFMQSASDGYCGAFPQPSEYWQGDEYFGHARRVRLRAAARDHHDDDLDHSQRRQRDHRRQQPARPRHRPQPTTPVNSTPGPPPPASGAGGF